MISKVPNIKLFLFFFYKNVSYYLLPLVCVGIIGGLSR